MIYPAAMFIESAQDALERTVPASAVAAQRKELECAIGDKATDQTAFGYALGLQTARIVLMGIPALYKCGIDPSSLL